MIFPRASGILLHPTSLPGSYGIGDLGAEAFRFVDFLGRSGQTYWQILPLGPTGYGDSPYQSFSAFAGNTLLISPEKLIEDHLITTDDLSDRPNFPNGKVSFGDVYHWKTDLLRLAYDRFRQDTNDGLSAEFEAFGSDNVFWLEDYALYRAIKASHEHKPWYKWPDEIKRHNADAISDARHSLKYEIEAEKFYQFLFFRQWAAVKTYANEKGVKIIGDIPIFVALDSADVWCNQDKFKLNEDGTPKFVAGVPPDYFSKTGQLWGNPIYYWDAMLADKFSWWAARIVSALTMADVVRLDHFIGFVRNWEVPGEDKTAENGSWIDVPGRELFTILRSVLVDLPVIAEDLGSLTPEVESLRDDFGMPGMRILQYGFGGDPQNRDLPHNYVHNSVAYSGTHDNDTVVGWYKATPKKVRAHCRKYLNVKSREINWNMIRAVMASVADTAIIPVQDILGLGSNARMNTPATDSGNWGWRLTAGDLTDEISARLRDLSEMYGRAQPKPATTDPEAEASNPADS